MIAKIAWSDQIRTGNLFMDLQHQDLIDLINELASSVESGLPEGQMSIVLLRLKNYFLFHFHMEENLMANNRVSVEHAQRHIRAHQAFQKRIESFSDNIGTAHAREVVEYLVNWLTDHILQTDQELAQLLRS